nr:unnamed protein product [Digitaria exilis]
MEHKSCPRTMPFDFTGNSLRPPARLTCSWSENLHVVYCSSAVPCPGAGNEAVATKRHGLTDEWQVLPVHHLPLLAVHIESACTLVLLHGEQDVRANHGIGRDADLRCVAVLQRVEAAREDRRWRKVVPSGATRAVTLVQVKDEEPGHEVPPRQDGGAAGERVELAAVRDQDGAHHRVDEAGPLELCGGFGVVDGGPIQAETHDPGPLPRIHRGEGHGAVAVVHRAGGGAGGELEDGVGGLLDSMLHHKPRPVAWKKLSSSPSSHGERE